MTFLFLQRERRRRTDPLPTFPEVRNLLREVMAALSFIERPQWLKLGLSRRLLKFSGGSVDILRDVRG
jgi:hypothetical protein